MEEDNGGFSLHSMTSKLCREGEDEPTNNRETTGNRGYESEYKTGCGSDASVDGEIENS